MVESFHFLVVALMDRVAGEVHKHERVQYFSIRNRTSWLNRGFIIMAPFNLLSDKLLALRVPFSVIYLRFSRRFCEAFN